MNTLYEKDMYLWSIEQINLLKQKKYDKLDLVHLIEEIEDLGNRHHDEIFSHMETIIYHMLKIKYSTENELEYNYNNWNNTIENAQGHICRLIRKYPSLKSYLISQIDDALEIAIERAQSLEYIKIIDDNNEKIDNWTPEIITGMKFKK